MVKYYRTKNKNKDINTLKISKMSGKLKGIRALNVNPLTNKFCQKNIDSNTICQYCYSKRMLKTFRQRCIPIFETNSRLLSKPIPQDKLPKLNDKIFRIHAHGELINKTHYKNIVNLIKKNPDTFFAFWTKRLDLIDPSIKPKNSNFIYSTQEINNPSPIIPKGFDKVFSVYTPEFVKKYNIKINCQRQCNKCKICYTKNSVNYINELLK